MAVDVARLGIKVDTTDLERGGAALEKFTQKGGKAEKSVQKVGAAASVAGRKLAGSSNSLRMASMQLSQVAQQGAVTGNYLGALAVQLPDLALGFGPVGILGGVAAGVLLQFGVNALNAEKKTEELSESLSELGGELSNLGGKYLSLAESIDTATGASQEFLESQLLLVRMELEKQLGELNELFAAPILDPDRFKHLGANFDYSAGAVKRLSESLGISRDVARELVGEAHALNIAVTDEDRLAALSDLRGELARVVEETGEWSGPLSAALELLLGAEEAMAAMVGIDIATGIGHGADAARILKEELAAALALHNAIASQGSKVYSGRGGDPRKANGQYTQELGYKPVDALIADLTKTTKGGGASKVSTAEREAARIYAATRTELEKYSAELAKLNELHKAGHIDAETYTRAIDKADDKYKEAASAASEFKEMNGLLKDSILDFAENGESAMDSLARAIKRAAFEALLFGEGPLAKVFGTIGGGSGGILGSIFSFDGGGSTGGGSRSGGLDGKGGFMAMLHPQETVIDHTKGQGGAAGSVDVRVYVDQGGNWQAAVEGIAGPVAARVTQQGLAQNNRMIAERQRR